MPLAQSGGNNVGSSQIIDNEIINDDVNAAAGIQYSKLDLSGGVKDTDVDTGNILQKLKIVNLSAANIIAMRVTPIELIAAPGAGKSIIVDEFIFSFTPGGTQFTGGGLVSTTGAYVVNIANAADINGAVAKNYAYYNVTTTPVVDTAVTITNATASFATGNGTAKVQIRYRIVTL